MILIGIYGEIRFVFWWGNFCWFIIDFMKIKYNFMLYGYIFMDVLEVCIFGFNVCIYLNIIKVIVRIYEGKDVI